MITSPFVATEHLSREVGAVSLVNDISVEFRRRELVAVVGQAVPVRAPSSGS